MRERVSMAGESDSALGQLAVSSLLMNIAADSLITFHFAPLSSL